jgi:micrococcal nuclease
MILLAICWPGSGWTQPAAIPDAIVVHVDDGDTIDVRVDGRTERVRYIGIDAPEIAHGGVGGMRGGLAAARLNRALLGDWRVRLEFDRERRDRYGRLLAYVWRGGAMINVEMVRRGYARALTIPPNVRYERWFSSAEAEARAAHRGLWGDGDLDDPPATMSPRRLPRSGPSRTIRPFPARHAAIAVTRPRSDGRQRWRAARATLRRRSPILGVVPDRGLRAAPRPLTSTRPTDGRPSGGTGLRPRQRRRSARGPEVQLAAEEAFRQDDDEQHEQESVDHVVPADGGGAERDAQRLGPARS